MPVDGPGSALNAAAASCSVTSVQALTLVAGCAAAVPPPGMALDGALDAEPPPWVGAAVLADSPQAATATAAASRVAVHPTVLCRIISMSLYSPSSSQLPHDRGEVRVDALAKPGAGG